MQTLSTRMLHLLGPFAPLFFRTRMNAQWPLPCGSWASDTSDGFTATIGCSIAPLGRVAKRVASYLGC